MFDTEMVLLDLNAGEYYSLNAIGSLAWNGFAAGQSAEDIATELTKTCDVEFDRALDDVLALGSELLSRGLLEARSDST
jgi:hypothetical protein